VEKKRGTDNVLETDVIKGLASKYQRTPVQIVLAWHLARGCAIIPKSSDFQR